MRVLLFGATGMLGQGVLRECLLAPDVESVLAVGRSPLRERHGKLRELLAPDLFDLAPHASELSGYTACFFCLGVSSAGMSEAEYRHLTLDLTLSVADLVARQNPGLTFVYVSGAGTDSTGRGRSMWARVKGETENALLRLPFKRAYLFRPGYIQPLHGATSRTRSYRLAYAVLAPLYPLSRRLFPRLVTTTELVGRAMLAAARKGAPGPVLETPGINALAG
ncbi:MAG TPA: epimerase [Anaeromyxobacteraceae bacterium]|nr:epimerase [Anaeromyxobacteraceae bacterium]